MANVCDGISSLKCSHCGFVTNRGETLKKHVRRSHRELPNTDTEAEDLSNEARNNGSIGIRCSQPDCGLIVGKCGHRSGSADENGNHKEVTKDGGHLNASQKIEMVDETRGKMTTKDTGKVKENRKKARSKDDSSGRVDKRKVKRIRQSAKPNFHQPNNVEMKNPGENCLFNV
ncbi:hypothetical protein J6590_014767 [Homalodisca vitripennis]|nr:hypothetical protein J6590_014767 [Homalodisca vitripennis]